MNDLNAVGGLAFTGLPVILVIARTVYFTTYSRTVSPRGRTCQQNGLALPFCLVKRFPMGLPHYSKIELGDTDAAIY
jgi:hypothetical protein